MACEFCDKGWEKYGAFHLHPETKTVDVMCDDRKEEAQKEAMKYIEQAMTMMVVAKIDFEFSCPPKNSKQGRTK